MSNDAIVMVGAGKMQVYGILEAQALGLYVIATDGNAQAPGAVLADEFYPIDIYDIRAHRVFMSQLRDAHPYRIRGVVGLGVDAAPTVAACAAIAETPGIPEHVAERTWSKAAVRDALRLAGLDHYQPNWHLDLPSLPSLDFTARKIIGYPCVVKPLSQRASRGVTIVREAADLPGAVEKICQLPQGTTQHVLVEQCLGGSEHSAEVVLDAHGACIHFHITDRYFDYSHGIPLESATITPSCLDAVVQEAIKQMLLDSARALNVTWGAWKNDVMVTAEGPKLLEATARCSGGFDSQVSYPLATDDNLLRRLIQLACDMPVTPQPPIPPQSYCAIGSIIPQVSGVVSALPFLDRAKSEIIWTVRPGDSVMVPRHCADRAGYFVFKGKDYESTLATARACAEVCAKALATRTAIHAGVSSV